MVLVRTQQHGIAILFVVGVVADGAGQHKAFPHREGVIHSDYLNTNQLGAVKKTANSIRRQFRVYELAWERNLDLYFYGGLSYHINIISVS